MCSSVEQYFVDVIFYSWQKGDNERMRQKSESRSSRRSRLKYSFRIARFFLQVNGKTARKFLGSPLKFIDINLKTEGPPLGTTSMDLAMPTKKNILSMVGFIYTFWYSLSSTSSILE